MNLMAAAGELESQFGGDDSAATIGRITGDADLHAPPTIPSLDSRDGLRMQRVEGELVALLADSTVANGVAVPYDFAMKATLAFVLWCAGSLFSQQAPSRCTPTSLGPFAFGGAATLKSDGYVYPRYFRYAKQWDHCIAHGKWPTSILAQFPDPFPAGLSALQRKIVTREAYEWDVTQQETVLTLSTPGLPAQMGPPRVTSWAQFLEIQQQLKQQAGESDEKEKEVAARLKKLRSRLGETAFALFEAHVFELLHATPGRMVPWQWPEGFLFARYLSTIAKMDKFAANAGEDGIAAAYARAEEQRACGLSDADEEILRRVADDYQKDTPDGPIVATVSRSESGQLVATAGGVNMAERIESHIRQLRQDLGEASFEKVEKRLRTFPLADHRTRLIPKDASDQRPESSGEGR